MFTIETRKLLLPVSDLTSNTNVKDMENEESTVEFVVVEESSIAMFEVFLLMKIFDDNAFVI